MSHLMGDISKPAWRWLADFPRRWLLFPEELLLPIPSKKPQAERESLASVRADFRACDPTGRGTIGQQQLIDLLRILEPSLSPRNVRRLMGQALTADGTVDFERFLDACCDGPPSPAKEKGMEPTRPAGFTPPLGTLAAVASSGSHPPLSRSSTKASTVLRSVPEAAELGDSDEGCLESSSRPADGSSCSACGGSGMDQSGGCALCLESCEWCGHPSMIDTCKHCDGSGERGYSYKTAHGIVGYSRDTCVRWLKRSSLRWLADAYGRVLRHQDLAAQHPEHFVSTVACLFPGGGMRPLVLSYTWLDRDHPDEHGRHLKDLLQWLQSAAPCGNAWAERISGVFMDFTSLPQRQRSHPEEASFKKALSAIDLLFAHDWTYVLRLDRDASGDATPYDFRGWCLFEMLAASTKFSGQYNVSLTGKDGTLLPSTPDGFEDELARSHFSNTADKSLVAKLYRQLFEKKVCHLKELVLPSLNDSDCIKLLDLLPCTKALEVLFFLHCSASLSQSAAGALAASLEAGAGPSLEALVWQERGASADSSAWRRLEKAATKRGLSAVVCRSH